MRILFVCLGNICRSPTAEAVMKGLLREEGLEDRVAVDSAGTGDWHVGSPPDARSAAAAAARGVELSGAARQVAPVDFGSWDLLVAMDRQNFDDLAALAPDEEARERVALLREFDPEAVEAGTLDVPDPYFGGPGGFDQVVEVVDRGCRGLLASLRRAGRLG